MSEARDSYHHGNLREALLQHASDLLVEGGPKALSLRQVASRAGVSRTAPYHHFRDKGALLAALVERGFRELVEGMRSPVDSDGPVMERFMAMGRAYVQFALDKPHHYRLMFGEKMLDAELHPSAVEAANSAFETCVRIVAEGQASGEVAGEDPRAIAMGAWSTVHGVSSLLMDKMADPEHMGPMTGLDVDDVVSACLNTLLLGVAKR